MLVYVDMLVIKSMNSTLCNVKSRADMFLQVPQLSSSPNSPLFTFSPTKPTLLMSDFNIAVTHNHYGMLSTPFLSLAAMAVSPQRALPLSVRQSGSQHGFLHSSSSR